MLFKMVESPVPFFKLQARSFPVIFPYILIEKPTIGMCIELFDLEALFVDFQRSLSQPLN